MMITARFKSMVRNAVIILILPILSACADFGCITPGSRGGCGPGTVVLMGAAVVVATPFILADAAIDGVSDMGNSINKKINPPAPDPEEALNAALKKKDWSEVLIHAQRMLARQPAPRSDWRYSKAMQAKFDALMALGRYAEAAELARKYYAEEPYAADLNLCTALIHTNQPADARLVCAITARRFSRLPAFTMLGHSYLLEGRTDEAFAQYRNMLYSMASSDKDICHFFDSSYFPEHFDYFASQGWQPAASLKAKEYVRGLYCQLGEVIDLKEQALAAREADDQVKAQKLKQQAESKAALFWQADDLAMLNLKVKLAGPADKAAAEAELTAGFEKRKKQLEYLAASCVDNSDGKAWENPAVFTPICRAPGLAAKISP